MRNRDNAVRDDDLSHSRQHGFTLVEFLLSTVILFIVSAAVFSLMADTQQEASYQREVQAVLSNTRIAIGALERYIRQTGNDPLGAGFDPIVLTSATEVRLRSDLTGSDGTDPDKGDPDGDTVDRDEDVTVRYNSTEGTIEIVTPGPVTRTLASNISAFTLQCFDAGGLATTVGAEVRKIRITISGATDSSHPKTKQRYGMTFSSDVQIPSRG